MLVAWEGHDQIIRQRINQQKTCEQERTALSIANGQPESCESEYRAQQKIGVARNHQVVARNDSRLRRRDPEVNGTLGGEPQKSFGMLSDKLANLLLLFGHEPELA